MESKLAGSLRKLRMPTSPNHPRARPCLEILKTVGDCVAFAKDCYLIAGNTLEELSEDQLTANIEAPFGTFPAWQYFNFMYDEHWHHRGQLYTYIRLLGKTPPMLYDYQLS